MGEFKKGQRVKVELEGEVSYIFSSGARMQVRDTNGILATVSTIRATLLDPADWPPQVGDIWEADGREWFARKGRVSVVVTPHDLTGSLDQDELKARNPVLVRRRGQ